MTGHHRLDLTPDIDEEIRDRARGVKDARELPADVVRDEITRELVRQAFRERREAVARHNRPTARLGRALGGLWRSIVSGGWE